MMDGLFLVPYLTCGAPVFVLQYILENRNAEKGRTTMFRKRASGTLALVSALVLLGACAEEPPKIQHNQITNKPLAREQVFYTQVKTSSDAMMGVIYHINAEGYATLLATNVEEAFWKKFVLALPGVVGQVGAAAVHGVSFPVAKTAINAAATSTGGSATSTSTSTSTANPTANACTGNNAC